MIGRVPVFSEVWSQFGDPEVPEDDFEERGDRPWEWDDFEEEIPDDRPWEWDDFGDDDYEEDDDFEERDDRPWERDDFEEWDDVDDSE